MITLDYSELKIKISDQSKFLLSTKYIPGQNNYLITIVKSQSINHANEQFVYSMITPQLIPFVI
jgi:hypothetical protein